MNTFQQREEVRLLGLLVLLAAAGARSPSTGRRVGTWGDPKGSWGADLNVNKS